MMMMMAMMYFVPQSHYICYNYSVSPSFTFCVKTFAHVIFSPHNITIIYGFTPYTTNTKFFTWFELVCSISLGQLCGWFDQCRPSDDASNLQILVHGLWSVQRLSGCRCQRDRRLFTGLPVFPFRDCSRLSLILRAFLPHGSLCE